MSGQKHLVQNYLEVSFELTPSLLHSLKKMIGRLLEKNTRLVILQLFIISLILFSCNDQESIKQAPALLLNTHDVKTDFLSSTGGSFTVEINSSLTNWKLLAKSASEGMDFVTNISPSFGGSMSEEFIETEVEITYKANKLNQLNKQELYLQALDGGHNILKDTSIILIQEAGDFVPSNVQLSPTWMVEARNFENGPEGAFDEISVKDPSIVFYEGKYHLFFTGRDATRWRMGYASAATLPELKDADHIYMDALNGGGYFCAPQVFWFEPQSKWYLVYQSGLGATFSTNTDISDPQGWAAGKTMGFGDGIDFWCIADESRVYCFYSSQDGSRSIKRRSTSIEDFPYNWTGYDVVATETFEAVHVYKNKSDGHYYMIVEDITRHQELWEALDLGGEWIKLEENWAHKDDLIDLADHWTDQVSHVEVIRSGYDEFLEVEDLNKCQLLIQGVVNGDYGDYGNIPYDLGIIKNY